MSPISFDPDPHETRAVRRLGPRIPAAGRATLIGISFAAISPGWQRN
jgi:hypothetical protein